MLYPRRLWTDVETTGFNHKKDNIVEIACILEIGQSTKYFHEYILPESFPADYLSENGAASKTGLTPDVLKQKGIPHYKAYHDLQAWLSKYVNPRNKRDKLVMCGKNINFDMDFLRELWKKNNDQYFGSFFYSVKIDIDDLMAQIVSEEKVEIENFKLETMARHFDVELEQAHSATSDIKATRELYYKLLKRIK